MTRHALRRRSCRHGSSGRRGYTLTELLVVIGAFGVVLSSVGLTLHSLAKVDRQIRAELPPNQTLIRLTLRLKQDAHQALTSELQPAVQPALQPETLPRTRWQLRGSDETAVEYEIRGTTVVRRESTGNQLRREERYHLPQARQVAWELISDQPRLVALRVEMPAATRRQGELTGRIRRTVFAVGLHPELSNRGEL